MLYSFSDLNFSAQSISGCNYSLNSVFLYQQDFQNVTIIMNSSITTEPTNSSFGLFQQSPFSIYMKNCQINLTLTGPQVVFVVAFEGATQMNMQDSSLNITTTPV